MAISRELSTLATLPLMRSSAILLTPFSLSFYGSDFLGNNVPPILYGVFNHT